MSKVEKIKAEIERRYEYWKEKESNSHSIESESRMSECQHLLLLFNSLQEEPVSNDLEEAAHSYIDTTIEWFDSEGNPCCYPAFIAGALWQKERDQSTIELAEDHAMLAGMDKMRQEMMKNVVLETKVMKDNDGDGIDTPYEEWLTLEDTEIPFIPDNIGLKDGDKVKILIIKQ